MRLAPLALTVGLAVVGGAACSDDGGDADPPPATGTEETFCVELRTAVVEHDTIFDPVAPTTAEETREATARLADAAPAEVAEPMRLLADTFAQVAEVLDEFQATDPEALEALEALGIDQDAIAEAQASVSTYARDTCGIDLEAINAASVTTTTGVGSATTVPTTVPTTTVPPVATTAPPVTG